MRHTLCGTLGCCLRLLHPRHQLRCQRCARLSHCLGRRPTRVAAMVAAMDPGTAPIAAPLSRRRARRPRALGARPRTVESHTHCTRPDCTRLDCTRLDTTSEREKAREKGTRRRADERSGTGGPKRSRVTKQATYAAWPLAAAGSVSLARRRARRVRAWWDLLTEGWATCRASC